MSIIQARHGWGSVFPLFRDTAPRVIVGKLRDFVTDVSPEQIRAWDDSIPRLQVEVGEVLEADPGAQDHVAILEYELPLESRRPDVVLLVRGAVVVLEIKGRQRPSQADLDQAAAYARDLRCYHRSCHPDTRREVHAVVVPMGARGYTGVRDGVHITGPDALDSLIRDLQPDWSAPVLDPRDFLAEDAYRPLPTLVQAARELMASGSLRRIHRARAATQPAVDEITRIIHEASVSRTRRLILLTGVPGSGKTLVGLQVVHAHYLDDLAEPRADGKPAAPAVFLSGNAPLVQVLQYELSKAGGGGKAFVRGVKDYVKSYSSVRHRIPPEHVLVFDEAQRAWDRDRVAEKHGEGAAKSEPEHFVEFAERVPGWCIVLGLIGGGQEIHTGEEGGLVQWRWAVERCGDPSKWIVHGSTGALEAFTGTGVRTVSSPSLNLDTEIRFHLASDLHLFVAGFLEGGDRSGELTRIALKLEREGYHLRVTRDLATASAYLSERYAENSEARFGAVASSRDKDLASSGFRNEYQRYFPVDRWFACGEGEPVSCRNLRDVATEFQVQGLELEAVLLVWGTDLIRADGMWSNRRAKRYMGRNKVRDPFRLRVNAYRVLLTRGRDGTVVFVPRHQELDETHAYMLVCGFRSLE